MAAKTDNASLPEAADSDCIPMFEDSNLPEGWSRKVAQRMTGKTAGTFDVYLFSPDGRKLRSKAQLEEYLKETNSDLNASEFDFTVRGRNSVSTPSASAKPTAKPKAKEICSTSRPRVTLKRVNDKPRHSPPTAQKKSVGEPVGRTRSSTSSSDKSKSLSPPQRRQPRARKVGNRTRAKRRIATSRTPKRTKDQDEDEDEESDDEPKKVANDADKLTRSASKRKKVDEEKQTPPSPQKSKLRSRTSYATTANVDPDSENTNDDSDSNNAPAGSESGTSMLNLSLTINGKSLWTWEWRINQALYKQLKRGGRLEKRMRKRVQKQGKNGHSKGKADTTRGAKSP